MPSIKQNNKQVNNRNYINIFGKYIAINNCKQYTINKIKIVLIKSVRLHVQID